MIQMIGSDLLSSGTWLVGIAVNQDMWVALIPTFSQGEKENALLPQPSYGDEGESAIQITMSCLGPCTPMVRVISMSAVREGPLISTVLAAWLIQG